MDEIREILQVVAQSTAATTPAAEAVKEEVEEKKAIATDGSKLIANPISLTTGRKKKRSKRSESGHGYLRNV